jgi:citrate synthase
MTQDLGFSKGLADVIADATSVSQVQGEEGRLIYRGIPIEELAQNASFEEVVHFLLRGSLPDAAELERTKRVMTEGRSLPQHVEALIDHADRNAHPMQVLQAAVATLSFGDGQVKLGDVEGNINRALKLTSQVATAVARYSRRRRGLEPVAPMPDLSHAENFLYMMLGKRPSREEAHIFDVSLVLHADHDFNASTFAARVIASTEAGLVTSVSGAIGALSGPLHGGANEKVLRMVDEIGSADKARAWVLDALQTKKKVMGFGHRVYRTMDPRAKVLRAMLEKLVNSKGDRKTYDTLVAVHDTMIEELSKKQKDYIWPNVDFWSGSLLRLLGIETIDFTPIFAVARVVGWSSHIIEMWQDNRIYRPAAKYVGPTDAQYIPIDKRRISA